MDRWGESKGFGNGLIKSYMASNYWLRSSMQLEMKEVAQHLCTQEPGLAV